MSQSLLTTDGLINVPDEPGVSSNGDIVMEPIDRLTEDRLLPDCEDSPNRIEPSQKPRSSRDKARPSGSEKNQYRNRQKDRTCQDDQSRGNKSRKCRRSETPEPEDLIEQSEQAIKSLQRHSDKGICPKSLQYRAHARIRVDEDFKSDIKHIRSQVEQGIVRALTRFHRRQIEKHRML